jgi:hypothetical protein
VSADKVLAEAVRIIPGACLHCPHHPLAHDLAHTLLTGEPAPCKEAGCDCKTYEPHPSNGQLFDLLDADGKVLAP